MRQKGNTRFIKMLYKIRVAYVNDALESLIKSVLALQREISYTIDASHLFAENKAAEAQNEFMINQLISECVFIKSVNKVSNNVVFSETDFELIKMSL